jgi:polyisoprenyl-phosphate glycosyltransferase
MVLSYNPLSIFLPVGGVLFLFGLGKMIVDFVNYDFHIATNTLLILFASFQIIAIGLLADLMVRLTRPSEEVPPASL